MDNAEHRYHSAPLDYLRQWCIENDCTIVVSNAMKSTFLASAANVDGSTRDNCQG